LSFLPIVDASGLGPSEIRIAADLNSGIKRSHGSLTAPRCDRVLLRSSDMVAFHSSHG